MNNLHMLHISKHSILSISFHYDSILYAQLMRSTLYDIYHSAQCLK